MYPSLTICIFFEIELTRYSNLWQAKFRCRVAIIKASIDLNKEVYLAYRFSDQVAFLQLGSPHNEIHYLAVRTSRRTVTNRRSPIRGM